MVGKGRRGRGLLCIAEAGCIFHSVQVTEGDTATEGCVSAYGAWKPLKRDLETAENLPALCENTQPELCIANLCPRRPLPTMAELLPPMQLLPGCYCQLKYIMLLYV